MDTHGLDRIARLVARRVHQGRSDGTNLAQLRNALASQDRPHFIPAVVIAIRERWVRRTDGGDLLYAYNTPPDETRLGLVADLETALRAADVTSA